MKVLKTFPMSFKNVYKIFILLKIRRMKTILSWLKDLRNLYEKIGNTMYESSNTEYQKLSYVKVLDD